MTNLQDVKISAPPSGWPTDGRSRRYELDGEIFLAHPDRANPYRYDQATKTWKEVIR